MYRPAFLPELIGARLFTNAEMEKRERLFKGALHTAEPLAAVCPSEWLGCGER